MHVSGAFDDGCLVTTDRTIKVDPYQHDNYNYPDIYCSCQGGRKPEDSYCSGRKKCIVRWDYNAEDVEQTFQRRGRTEEYRTSVQTANGMFSTSLQPVTTGLRHSSCRFQSREQHREGWDGKSHSMTVGNGLGVTG